MSDTKVFYCKLCEKSWGQLPDGAVQLTHIGGPGYNMYRFPDGSTHSIRLKKARNAKVTQ